MWLTGAWTPRAEVAIRRRMARERTTRLGLYADHGALPGLCLNSR